MMQIINIGIDIEEVARIARLKKAALARVFTETELAYSLPKKNAAQHLAARFAAKEAIFKALPFDGVALKKIEIVKDKTGKPLAILHDARAKDIGLKISLSHTRKYAAAFAVSYRICRLKKCKK
ncbi:MAG: holo-ACP synthase [Elusimicrobiota bacterium]|jgi:holo-[acyl-carrier protein] synthase|nr:holo-ACP synthase [Elusimicrobiota bacterium]MDR0734655.1 holo-ACP synthase [Elusimicrobiota bacterium]